MANTRFSIRLDSDLKDWLEQEAKRKDRSAGYIATQAIQSLRLVTEKKRQIIHDAALEADRGEFISEEEITKWFISLETDNELAEPKPDVFIDKS